MCKRDCSTARCCKRLISFGSGTQSTEPAPTVRMISSTDRSPMLALNSGTEKPGSCDNCATFSSSVICRNRLLAFSCTCASVSAVFWPESSVGKPRRADSATRTPKHLPLAIRRHISCSLRRCASGEFTGESLTCRSLRREFIAQGFGQCVELEKLRTTRGLATLLFLLQEDVIDHVSHEMPTKAARAGGENLQERAVHLPAIMR